MTRNDENLDCVGGVPVMHAVAKELYDDAIAALAVIAEMGDKTLIALLRGINVGGHRTFQAFSQGDWATMVS